MIQNIIARIVFDMQFSKEVPREGIKGREVILMEIDPQ